MAEQAELICGEQQASCFCGEIPEHDGPHVCDCGGSWEYDDEGHFIVVTYPRMM